MAFECEAFVLSERGAGNPTSLSLAPQQGAITLTARPKTQLSNNISAETHSTRTAASSGPDRALAKLQPPLYC